MSMQKEADFLVLSLSEPVSSISRSSFWDSIFALSIDDDFSAGLAAGLALAKATARTKIEKHTLRRIVDREIGRAHV